MSQYYKNVYFADYRRESTRRESLTIAFSGSDKELFDTIKPLTSHEVRELLGYSNYTSLQAAANDSGLSLNTYCLMRLRRAQQSLANTEGQYALFESKSLEEAPFKPIQATFRGGETEPLHTWYPMLEGYSPAFVKSVLEEFAPKAINIFDPFAGSGTTPLTASMLGKNAFYCEINPLFQYLISTKATALITPSTDRAKIADSLEHYADRFSSFLLNVSGDADLDHTYNSIFGSSEFFDHDSYRDILCARTLIDQIACEDPIVSQFVAIAILSSLIPSSRLIRRGDLRFKNEVEHKKQAVTFTEEVANHLHRIANDLRRLEMISTNPIFVCEDARNLLKLPRLILDAVVTSPPYLNGTNYFRNTKIELWFLRALGSQKDLTAFRYKSITAGINDVTLKKSFQPINGSVRIIVDQLTENAYDKRIPRMVGAYFSDMREVLLSIIPHMSKHARFIIDIGDSTYAGVHVPTDILFSELMENMSFRHDHEITLRKRTSRGGFPLKQALLVFTLISKRSYFNQYVNNWRKKWELFKDTLPHQEFPFNKRNWGHPLHSLCSYQGKMKPSLAHHLVRIFLPEEGRMLDPFGGVGTIPFEAALQGATAWSFDISPAAVHIATAKLTPGNIGECSTIIDKIEEYICSNKPMKSEYEAVSKIRFNGPLSEYFHPRTLDEIILTRRFFRQIPLRSPSESLVFASLLHILHGNRPYSLSRRSHPITPFSPTGPSEYRALVPRLREKVLRSLETKLPDRFKSGKSLYQDALSWWPQEIEDLDAIITSPPFYDSTRFYLANWMRLWFSGWEANDFQIKPLAFVDEKQKQSFKIYEPVFRQARERLKTNGIMVCHLGKSKKCNMAERLAEIARPYFHVVDLFTEDVSHCESHGIRDKGTVNKHTFLLLN